MTTITEVATTLSLPRILDEGYGPGAWHGPDLKAALTEVSPEQAFRRPAPGRHNIAEIALHHAYCVRSVRSQLTGRPAEPFVLDGEDWFELEVEGPLSWPGIQSAIEAEQQKVAAAVAALPEDSEHAALVLGLTCHAVYHAGQVQLIRRLQAE